MQLIKILLNFLDFQIGKVSGSSMNFLYKCGVSVHIYPVSLFKFSCQNYYIMLQLSRGAILHLDYYFRSSASDV